MSRTNVNVGSQSIAQLSANAAAVLEEVRASHHPVMLTEGGQEVAVLLDIESFHSLLEELELLRDVQRGLADVEAGRVIPQEEVRRILPLTLEEIRGGS